MDCSQIIPAVRAAIHHLPAGVKAAVGRGHLRHLRHFHAARPGTALRAVVARACRQSMLPAIVAGTIAGGMLTKDLPPARAERLTMPEAPAGLGFNPASGSVPPAGTEPGPLPVVTSWLWRPGSPPTNQYAPPLPVTGPPTTVPPANALPVAEPASLGILAAGAASLLWVRRRRGKHATGANAGQTPHQTPDQTPGQRAPGP